MDVSKRGTRKDKKLDESPYNRREEASTKKAFKSVEKSVKPVAKDTNKTRRKVTKADITGPTVKKTGPMTNLKSDMKKPMMNAKPGSLKCRKM